MTNEKPMPGERAIPVNENNYRERVNDIEKPMEYERVKRTG